MDKNTKFSELFWSFAKVGVLTFGGGVAMLPILEREVIDNRHWTTEEELMDYYAIGQCTPGLIAVNTATFIGQKMRGIPGGIIATFGVVFPSLVIIMFLAGLIDNYASLPVVARAFSGIRVAVVVLIFNAVRKLLKKSVIDKVTLALFLIILLGNFVFNISPILFVLLSAVTGILAKNAEVENT